MRIPTRKPLRIRKRLQDLHDTGILDLQGLAPLVNLEELLVAFNTNLASIDGIATLTKLKELNLSITDWDMDGANILALSINDSSKHQWLDAGDVIDASGPGGMGYCEAVATAKQNFAMISVTLNVDSCP